MPQPAPLYPVFLDLGLHLTPSTDSPKGRLRPTEEAPAPRPTEAAPAPRRHAYYSATDAKRNLYVYRLRDGRKVSCTAVCAPGSADYNFPDAVDLGELATENYEESFVRVLKFNMNINLVNLVNIREGRPRSSPA